MVKNDESPTGVILDDEEDEMSWHPLQEHFLSKKYRCSRCGEPKVGHVCKMVVMTKTISVQSNPDEPVLKTGCKTISVSASNIRRISSRPNSRPNSLDNRKHRRLLSDPFPLSSSVEMLDFGLSNFELINDAAVDKMDLLDDLFSAELVVDDDQHYDIFPPPPPPDRSPRTPFFETSPPVPAKRKGHRRIHSAPDTITADSLFQLPPLHPTLPRIIDDV